MTQMIKIIDARTGKLYECPHEATMADMRAFFHPNEQSNGFQSAKEAFDNLRQYGFQTNQARQEWEKRQSGAWHVDEEIKRRQAEFNAQRQHQWNQMREWFKSGIYPNADANDLQKEWLKRNQYRYKK